MNKLPLRPKNFHVAAVTNGTNMPKLLSCDVTLKDDRRTDLKNLFYMNAPCATTNAPIWSNQENFNYFNFKLQAIFEPTETTFPLENYVSKSGFGIVDSNAHIIHSKENKDQSVTFNVKSGGFRYLHNINTNRFYRTDVYNGHTVSETVEFKFDFVAPKHCSEQDSGRTCIPGEEPITVDEDFTKNPITPKWSGWFDDLSGLFEYRLEAYLLEPNIHDELIELNPLSPVFTYTENNTNNVEFPTFTPPRSGMFSVLLTATDTSNNSKTSRRLVLFDDSSEITITKPGLLTKLPDAEDVEQIVVGDGGLYIVSAVKETGFMWQTSETDSKSRIEINWENHFINKLHNDGKLLNKVLPFPTQFQDFEDDGVLRSTKYVAIDDNEGDRTLKAIPNKHGLVKFELNRVFTNDRQIPVSKWEQIPLEESYVFWEQLDDGNHVRVWLRATDVMNNTAVDYTEVHFDNTPPRISDELLEENVQMGTYTFTSRVTFQASDDASDFEPTNIRIEERLSSGVRLTWDIPETPSCYWRVDITLVVFLGNGQTREIQVNSEQTSVDIVGLDPDKEYSVSLNVGLEGTELASLPYIFQTGNNAR
ncbi:hypothetical protein MAR_035372 [Mya arenaria]|uniref:Fibronectin type-III domain-containing protein n=1 Tax=Mya arenaria TaxID=6604 RepID=A0ABY7ENJ0_MYAAR|nr:hypothetical protein MAR_035372 [Mya arenaria]